MKFLKCTEVQKEINPLYSVNIVDGKSPWNRIVKLLLGSDDFRKSWWRSGLILIEQSSKRKKIFNNVKFYGNVHLSEYLL